VTGPSVGGYGATVLQHQCAEHGDVEKASSVASEGLTASGAWHDWEVEGVG